MKNPPVIVSNKDWQDLIGIQFALGGGNPQAGLNCYGLVREVYKGLQMELPQYQETALSGETVTEYAGNDWVELDEPIPYAVALIKAEGNHSAFHLAVVTPELTLLHALPKKGVIVSPVSAYRHRILGFYRYVPGQGQRLPVANGDVGRIIGAILITIVAIVATVYGGPAAAGTWGLSASMWGGLFGAAVMIGGTMIMNAIAPIQPANPQLNGPVGDGGTTYTWDGITNDFKQGAYKAMIFGRVRCGGQIISEKTWFDGANNEYLDMLICPCVGRVTRFTGLEFNDTDLSLYANTSAVFRPGDDQQSPISLFNQIHLQYGSAAKIPYDASVSDPANSVQFSTKSALSGIRLVISAPNGIYEMPVSTPIPHSVTFRVEYRQSGTSTWAPLALVDPNFENEAPFIKRTAGVFTGSANPYTLTDAGADFVNQISALAEFKLLIDTDTYYCVQGGDLTVDAIDFEAFTDEGHTTPLGTAPANGAYVILSSKIIPFTGAITVISTDTGGDMGAGDGGGGADGGGSDGGGGGDSGGDGGGGGGGDSC